jgi:hypothetical protein
MSQATAHSAERTGTPGGLMRLVAEGLTGNDFKVGPPERDDERCLSIDIPAAHCALTVEDWGSVVLDWDPAAGSAVDPLELADLASALLTGRPGPGRWEGDSGDRTNLTLKGRVGRELQARGLHVELEVYPDDEAFEAGTEIVASAPSACLDAEVRVDDHGRLGWERDYGTEEAAICPELDNATWLADPGKVASDIVAAVTLALSHGLPSHAGQQ